MDAKEAKAKMLISIHAPLRGRLAAVHDRELAEEFQSTPPCGGDHGIQILPQVRRNFNPRPLAGATGVDDPVTIYTRISIHAPLRGRRHVGINLVQLLPFQSTPPCGGDGRSS